MIVGSAEVVVRAITRGAERDMRNAFRSMGRVGGDAGANLGRSFSRGFNRNVNTNIFNRITNGINSLVPSAGAARSALASLTRTSFVMSTGLSVLVGGISSVIGGLGALAGSAGGALGALAALGPVIASIGIGMRVASFAMGGIGAAVSAANRAAAGGGGGGGGGDTGAAAAAAREAAARRVQDAEEALARTIESNRESLVEANNDVREAQLALNEALAEGREEIQQLGFDAEDAALGEQRAAMELNRAREALARMQDLPPNSRARQEAELAYAEADLNLRRAMDRSRDLNAEQERLARTGVAGTSAVIGATDALARAEANRARTARDGARAEADAIENLADARADAATAGQNAGGAAGGGAGGADPYAGLNEAQEAFARFIVGLKPKFDELKAAATDSFLPLLQTAIQTVVDGAWPTLVTGIGLIGTAMGNASISIANAIVEGRNLENLGKVFEGSAKIIEILGEVAGNIWGILLSTLVAATPLALRFTRWLEGATAQWDAWASSIEGQASMRQFFDRAGDSAAKFGEIFGNIFGGLGTVIDANMGPGTGGDNLLNWLTVVTQGFEDIPRSEMVSYFQDVATNSQAIFSSIGALIGELGELGRNQAIGETFRVLEEGAPFVGDLLNKAVEAGPAMAELINNIVDIANSLTDTASLDVFFGTLNTVVAAIADILKNDVVANIVATVSIIGAFLLALGALGNVGRFVFSGLAGGVGLISGALGTVVGVLRNVMIGIISLFNGVALAKAKDLAITIALQAMYLKDAAVRLAVATATRAMAIAQGVATAAQWLFNAAMSANPIGIIIVAIAALVAALIWFFTSTELGQEMWTNFMNFLTDLWNAIVDIATNVWEGLASFFTDTWNNITGFIEDAVAFIQFLIVNWLNIIKTVWNNIWKGISDFFGGIWEWIVNFVTTYINTVRTIITTVINVIMTIWNNIWQGISNFFGDIWEWIVNFVTIYINTVRTIIDNVTRTIKTIWNGIWKGINDFFTGIWEGIVDFVTDMINNVKRIIDNVTKTIKDIWNGIWKGIGDFFKGIWDKIVDAVEGFEKIFKDIFGGIKGFVKSAFDGVLSAVRGPINGIIGIVNDAIRALNRLSVKIPDWVPFVGGQTWSLNLPTIPQLAKGGIIPATPGGMMVNVAEAGRSERIEPLDDQGLSRRDRAMIALLAGNGEPVQIILNPPPGTSNEEIAAMVSREIAFRRRKGAVA